MRGSTDMFPTCSTWRLILASPMVPWTWGHMNIRQLQICICCQSPGDAEAVGIPTASRLPLRSTVCRQETCLPGGGCAVAYSNNLADAQSADTIFTMPPANVSLTATFIHIPSRYYVDINNAAPSAPYTNWSTAANNIQDAVDAASDGDIVVVTNGHYVLTSEISVARAVAIQSVNGPAETIIDGQGSVRCFNLGNTECIISGMAITAGYDDSFGGGIYCTGLNPVLTNCLFSGNFSGSSGGGLYYGTAIGCVISSNAAHMAAAWPMERPSTVYSVVIRPATPAEDYIMERRTTALLVAIRPHILAEGFIRERQITVLPGTTRRPSGRYVFIIESLFLFSPTRFLELMAISPTCRCLPMKPPVITILLLIRHASMSV